MSKIEKGRSYYQLYKDEAWTEASEFICELNEAKLRDKRGLTPLV
jgi:hypothetical protein